MRKFDLQKSFRYGGELVHAGVYRVPNDMTEVAAKKAEADGLGEWVAEPKVAKPISAPRITRKTPAPENKALNGAPEDKDEKPFPAEED